MKTMARLTLVGGLWVMASANLLAAETGNYLQALDQCHQLATRLASGEDLPPAELAPCETGLGEEQRLSQLSIRVEPWQAQSLRINYAIALAEMGWLDQALETYQQAARLEADPAPLYLNRATLYLYRQEYELAVEDLTRAMLYENQRAKALYNRALVNHYAENYLQAQDDFQALAAQYPADYLAWVTNEDLIAIYPVELGSSDQQEESNSVLPGSPDQLDSLANPEAMAR